MMKKQVLFTILAMLVSVSAFSHDIEVKNADGVTIYYNYSADGKELTVTYQGSSYDSSSYEYSGKVVIPETVTYDGKSYPVTSIGGGAFCNCSGLTSIDIPNSVTSIGEVAFGACTGLISVEIPNSVTSIGEGAFVACAGLISVEIPNSVTSIEGGAFYDCRGLTSIVSLIESPFAITGKNADIRTFPSDVFYNATLYVPGGTIEKYKSTEGWMDFAKIEEINVNNIGIIIPEEEHSSSMYQLNGIKVNEGNLGKGIYIQNGKKMLVK